MLLLGGTDPVNLGIIPDSIVEGVDQDDFKILVSSVLSYMVGVQYTQSL